MLGKNVALTLGENVIWTSSTFGCMAHLSVCDACNRNEKKNQIIFRLLLISEMTLFNYLIIYEYIQLGSTISFLSSMIHHWNRQCQNETLNHAAVWYFFLDIFFFSRIIHFVFPLRINFILVKIEHLQWHQKLFGQLQILLLRNNYLLELLHNASCYMLSIP